MGFFNDWIISNLFPNFKKSKVGFATDSKLVNYADVAQWTISIFYAFHSHSTECSERQNENIEKWKRILFSFLVCILFDNKKCRQSAGIRVSKYGVHKRDLFSGIFVQSVKI